MPHSTSPQRRLRAAVFAPLVEGGKVELVEERIVRGISSGVLGEGDRLPSEADMASSLGVATVTAREALAGLRRRGFVVTKRGRDGGTFVTLKEDERERLLNERLARTSLVELRDLALHYRVVASAAAQLAADKADSDDISTLGILLDDTMGPRRPGQRSADLLLEIAALSHSARLTREFVRLHADFGSFLTLAHGDPEFESWASAWGQRIVDAVRASDAPQLGELAAEYTNRGLGWLIAERDQLVHHNEERSHAG